MRTIAFEAIGTHWRIDINGTSNHREFLSLSRKIVRACEHFDQTYSRFRGDSYLARISKKAGAYRLPDSAKALFDTYYEMYRLTGGLFTPLIGQVLTDAGYDSDYSLKRRSKLRRPPEWEAALQYEFPTLRTLQPVELDFGAGGKGYLVDIVARLVRANGYTDFCIDGSGDIHYSNPSGQAMDIGLEHPGKPGQVIGTVKLIGGDNLCASAGNRRAWDGFHHIINPSTLRSPTRVLATWVKAETALTADVLATALFFTPPADLRRRYDFSCAIVKNDYTYDIDASFGAEMF